RIGRQVEQAGAAGLDGLAHSGDLVAAEVVHDDDVAWPQLGGEHLLDIGSEDAAVHGLADHEGRDDGIGPQAGAEGRGAPVAVRHPALEARTARSAAAEPGHVGRRPGLVDEDETLEAQLGLALSPSRARLGNVGARLLARPAGLFLNVRPSWSSVFHIPPTLDATPWVASSQLRNSSIVASGTAATRA